MNTTDEPWYYASTRDTADSELSALLALMGLHEPLLGARALKAYMKASRVGVSAEAVRRLAQSPRNVLPAPDGWDQRLKTALEGVLQLWLTDVRLLRPAKVEGFPVAATFGKQRSLLLTQLATLPQLIRTWAPQYVRDNPARAAALYGADLRLRQPLLVSRLALDAITGWAGSNTNKQDRTGKLAERMHKSLQWLRGQLKDMPHGGLTADAADLEVVAVASLGGLHPLLTGVLSLAMLRTAVNLATCLLETDPRQARYVLDELADYPEGVCLATELAKFPIWGDYLDAITLCSHIPVRHWPGVLLAPSMTNAIMDSLGAKLTNSTREARSSEKAHQAQVDRLQRELKEANNKLRRLEGKGNPPGLASATAKAASTPPRTDELAQLTRRNTQLKRDVEQMQEQVKELRQLLDSVLRDTANEPAELEALTPAELNEIKGIIIGGHQNFTYKLRKLMPNCLYYSADHKRIDAAAFPDRDFVLFFTGYCNHALFENAVRECRQHAIPVGYSSRVNLDLFLEEVARLARSKPAEATETEPLAVSSS